VDRQYGGFPYLTTNWDSLKSLYRPEVEAGVSRGRFDAIMGQLYLALQEIHTWIYDAAIDSANGMSVYDVYLPGVPWFWPSGWGWAGNFGAGLTPLPDSSLLVYRTIASHPLGIVPGDVILGYDRIPWKRLYKELLEAGLPLEWFGEGRWGSSPRSMIHGFLNSAGNNWGLFDTIDVVKYSTGDTVHLPTFLLTGLGWNSLFATEQVSVPGVHMPNYAGGENVSWGVVDNTSVGYVYVYSWDASVGPLFASAMSDLITVKKVSGLILDFRYNRGSYDSWVAANAGLDYLFAEDPCGPSRWRAATRLDPANHFSFSFSPDPAAFSPRPDYYNRPIAVLTGPQAWSVGDHTAFRMRFHPMVRFFGLPTNGAFVYGITQAPGFWGTWSYNIALGQMQSLINNEGFLAHKSFPVDEEVWLTRDGVAKGKDDVVERALAWITNLTYAHDVAIDRSYVRPHLDTVLVTARLTNPLNHSTALSAIVNDTGGVVRDSVLLYNDGMHGDGLAGDSIWGCRIPVPSDDGLFQITVRTDDITQGTFRKLPKIAGFATAGPLTLDSVDVYYSSRGGYYGLTPYVRNNDSSFTVRGATVTLHCNDPWVTDITAGVSLPDLPPGAREGPTSPVIVYCNASANPTYFNLKAEISVGGVLYWTDSTKRMLTGIGKQEALPVRYALEQNYPNPFNPSTTIRYELPKTSHVSLSVYDVLGREVSVLVNERRDAGVYEIKFDGSGLSSGVYFYRIQAG